MTTEHSKQLRGETANKHKLKLLKEGKIKMFASRGPSELVDEVRERLSILDGESHLVKIKRLLDFYDKHNK